VDDSQIYDYDHQDEESSQSHGSHRPQSRASQHNAENGYRDQNQQYGGRQGSDYYPYGRSERRDHEEDDDEDMW
jgi:hypothetical protein